MGKRARHENRAKVRQREQDAAGMILARLRAHQCTTCGRAVGQTVVKCGLCAHNLLTRSARTNPPCVARIRLGGAIEGDLSLLNLRDVEWLFCTLVQLEAPDDFEHQPSLMEALAFSVDL